MKRKLLLADDSITIQKVVGIIFATEDYDLTMTDDGNSAFDQALELIPDLVLADISMPGKDGFELCRAIKNEPSLARTSVLLLPGAFDHFDESKAQDACADGWLTKPFESQALLDKVAQLIEAEPLQMDEDSADEEEVAESEQDPAGQEVEGDPAVSEVTLGLDAVDELAADEPLGESSADDIWDAVSFEEEDLQADVEQGLEEADEDPEFVVEGFGEPGDLQDEESVAEPLTHDFSPSGLADTPDDEDDFVVEDIADEGEQEEVLEEAMESTMDEMSDVGVSGVAEEVAAEEVAAEPDTVDFSSYSSEEPSTLAAEIEEPVLAAAYEESDAEEIVTPEPEADDSVFEFSADEDIEPLELAEVEESSADDDFVFTDEEASVGDFDAVQEEASVDSDELNGEVAFAASESEPSEDPAAEDSEDDESPFVFTDESVEEDDDSLEEPFGSDDDDVEEIFELSEDDVVEDLSEEDVVEDVDDSLEAADSLEADAQVEFVEQEDIAERDVAPESEVIEAESYEDEVGVEELEELQPEEEESFYFDEEAGSESSGVSEAVIAAGTAAVVAPVIEGFGKEEAPTDAVAQVENQLRELSAEELEEIVVRVAGPIVEEKAKEMLEQIAWEVVPDLAEAMIKEEIRKIKQAVSQ